jgi:hypothetical protein
VILVIMGLLGVGIGVTIGLTNLDSILGLRFEEGGLFGVLSGLATQIGGIDAYALVKGVLGPEARAHDHAAHQPQDCRVVAGLSGRTT